MIYLPDLKGIDEVSREIMERLLWHPEEYVDLTKSPSVYSYDNLLTAKSCKFEVNLASLGLTKNRWSRFLTQYVKKTALEEWLELVESQRPGIVSVLRATGETDVTPDHYHPERKGHRWGPCFLGIGFQKTPKPKLTLYSRTARVPTTATMELALVSQLAKEIQSRCSLKSIGFVWFCSSFNITAWDVLPYMVYAKMIHLFLASGVPLALYVRRQYERAQRLAPTRADIPYGRQRRITNRVQQMERGEFLPDCWTQNLSIWAGHA